jgi:thioredoxin-like negative regulator of GroEL
MLSSQSIHAAQSVFVDNLEDAFILSQESNQDILIVFGADWCPSCKLLKKDINENVDQFNSIVCFVDFDKRPDLVKEYMVKIIPDSIIYRENVEIKRRKGYMSFKDFHKWYTNE